MTTDLTLTLTRHIKASPATVWRCWTDPELLAKWFAPDPVQITTCEVDPKLGGVFNVVMQMPGHDPMVAPRAAFLSPTKTRVWSGPRHLDQASRRIHHMTRRAIFTSP